MEQINLDIKLNRVEDNIIASLIFNNNSSQDFKFRTASSKIFDFSISRKTQDDWDICWMLTDIEMFAVHSWLIPSNEKIVRNIRVPNEDDVKNNIDKSTFEFITEEDEDVEDVISEYIKDRYFDFNDEDYYKFSVDVSFFNRNETLKKEIKTQGRDIKEGEIPSQNISERRVNF